MKFKIGFIFVFLGIIGVIIFNNKNYRQHKEKLSNVSKLPSIKKTNGESSLRKKNIRKKNIRKKRTISGHKKRVRRSKNILQSIGPIKKIKVGGNHSYSFFPNRFASPSKIPGRKLIRTYRSFFIYEANPDELENVLVNSKTNNVVIWTGEIIIQSDLDVKTILSSYSNFEYKTQVNDLHVIKVIEGTAVFESITEISKIEGITKIELDLQKSRKERI